MPVFEYRCEECSHEFEKLVFSASRTVCCPTCASADVVKRPSTFGMSGVEHQTSSGSCGSCSSGSCSGCSCH